MGEYLPPPYGIIQLAAYLEKQVSEIHLEVLDCNAEKVDWKNMEQRIAASKPDVVACASLGTCNTYAVAKTLETAKRIGAENDNIAKLYGQLGGVLELSGSYDRALENYEEMRSFGHRKDRIRVGRLCQRNAGNIRRRSFCFQTQSRNRCFRR